MRKKVETEVRDDGWGYLKYLTGELADSIGYVFDPKRIQFKTEELWQVAIGVDIYGPGEE